MIERKASARIPLGLVSLARRKMGDRYCSILSFLNVAHGIFCFVRIQNVTNFLCRIGSSVPMHHVVRI